LKIEEMVHILKIYKTFKEIGKWLRGGEAPPLVKSKKMPRNYQS